MKKCIALSLGDPAGISPEITAKSLDCAVRLARPVVFGHGPSLERAMALVPASKRVELVPFDGAAPADGTAALCDTGPRTHGAIDTPSLQAADAQLGALERAVDAVLDGPCEALVTAPISKEWVARRMPGFTGHTEYLARRAGLRTDEVTMVFATERLLVGLVTTHLPLIEVPAAVTRARLQRTLGHLMELASRARPGARHRIAVAALNPHAGESGLLGREELDVIEPFCREAKEKLGLDVEGPVPADAVFKTALSGGYDAVVALYHDQALIPLKLQGFGTSVNMTAGLPFVRTSPDHGVGYDIAGQGRADDSGMRLAIVKAVEFAT